MVLYFRSRAHCCCGLPLNNIILSGTGWPWLEQFYIGQTEQTKNRKTSSTWALISLRVHQKSNKTEAPRFLFGVWTGNTMSSLIVRKSPISSYLPAARSRRTKIVTIIAIPATNAVSLFEFLISVRAIMRVSHNNFLSDKTRIRSVKVINNWTHAVLIIITILIIITRDVLSS